jgi:NAD(P)H-dependent FMN reductase
MADTLNVITICGSLRKGSYNAALARMLPKFAPPGMTIGVAPPWNTFPIYNADDQAASGFPAPVQTLAEAIRRADGVIIVSPEYNYGLPGGLKNAIDWLSRLENQPLKDKPIAIQSATGGPLGGIARPISMASGLCISRRACVPAAGSFRRYGADQIRRQARTQGPADDRLRQAAARHV